MRSCAAFGLSLCLSGCGGYWYAAPEYAAPVERVIVTADAPSICASSVALGCWIVSLRTIFIKAGMSAADTACVEKHERKHAAGMNHDPRRTYRIDCGE